MDISKLNPNRISGGGAQSSAPITAPVPPSLEQAASQRPQGPSYFGYHTDASILARMAQQGVPPNAINLRIAQQMLSYGIPLSNETVTFLRQLWQGLGGASLVQLEALLALFSMNMPTTPENLQAMMQLLSGGPMSHLLARLTMQLKNGQVPVGLNELKGLLNGYWKLGASPEGLAGDIGAFQQLMARLQRITPTLDPSRMPQDIAAELSQVRDLMHAHKLLVPDPRNTVYVPFFQWRDQQPMPSELLVQSEQDPASQAAGFTKVTLAVETRNLGRMTLDFTVLRGHLNVKVEVGDTKIKQLVERGLPDLRHRLVARTPYQVATIMCQEVGQGRAISVLLPRRRDVRKLRRALGII